LSAHLADDPLASSGQSYAERRSSMAALGERPQARKSERPSRRKLNGEDDSGHHQGAAAEGCGHGDAASSGMGIASFQRPPPTNVTARST
jgi:hypothetical protein